jgi:enamine deaminase RidA (YjgF/YER057c/UK114 family)
VAVEVLNPEGLSSNPAYAQSTVASGRRTVVVGGQSGVDRHGTMADGIAAQTEQALRP